MGGGGDFCGERVSLKLKSNTPFILGESDHEAAAAVAAAPASVVAAAPAAAGGANSSSMFLPLFSIEKKKIPGLFFLFGP